MLPHDSQKFQRHTTGEFGARFPFLNSTFADVATAGAQGLADVTGFAQLLDLFGLELRLRGHARFIEAAHDRMSIALTLCSAEA